MERKRRERRRGEERAKEAKHAPNRKAAGDVEGAEGERNIPPCEDNLPKARTHRV
jgi:hypothetical protein